MMSVAAITSLLFTGLVWAQPAAAANTCGTEWLAKWPAGGTGSSATPYLVDSQASLAAISDCSGRYFALEKNITLTGAWTPIFDGSSGQAYLDGRGWSISGLSITGSIERAGLFGNLTGGSVSNLTLMNPSLTSTHASGFLGGFAGYGPVDYSNVHVVGGTISGAGYVGGIVGGLENGSISRSSSTAALISTASTASYSVGGLTTYRGSNGTITESFAGGSITISGVALTGGVGGINGNTDAVTNNSYSTTVINAPTSSSVGGISGRDNCFQAGKLQFTYATGSISGASSVGGVTGSGGSGCSATAASFFDTQTTGQSSGTIAGAVGKTTAQMKDDTTYVGWSTSIWRLVDGSYPTFKNGIISVGSTTNFGNVTVGGPSSQTITVTNSGDDTLSVLDTDVSGTNASGFTVGSLAGCASVAPSATCTFTVSLTATAAGSQSASLAIATSDGVGNVALSGTAAAASAATVTWTPISTPTAGPFTYTLTFSTSITGLATGDFTNGGTATGCAFSPSASSGTTFTITITSCSSGTLIARITAGSVATSVGGIASPIGANAAVNTLASSWSVGNRSTAMAISRDGSKLYTFSAVSGEIKVYSTATNTLSTTISLTLPVTATTGYLVASPVANLIYVATNERSNGIYVINTDNDTQVTASRVIPTTGSTSLNNMSISPDGRHLYLPGGRNGAFLEIKVDTSATPMTVQSWPSNITSCGTGGVQGVVVSSDSSRLYQLGGATCSSYVWTQLTSAFTTAWPSTYSNTSYPYRVQLSSLVPTTGVLSPDGTLLYLSSSTKLQSFDATQPISSSSPAGASSVLSVNGSAKNPMAISADGTRGYLPSLSGANVVNLSTMALASPSSLSNPGKTNANTAILSKDGASLYVLDGISSADPASVSQFALASLQAESVTVVVKNPQTVTWAPTTSITTTTTAPSATATTNGNGTISYAVTSAGTTGCTVNSSTAALTFTGAGSCQITASATETTTYAATSTAVTFTVALTPQTITVSAGTTTPEVFSTTGLSTSGVVGTGQVTYAVASGGSNCSIANSTLTGSAVGSCTVTSSVTADAMYASATSSAITISVQKAPQTVTWAPTNTSLSFNDSPVTPSVGATTDGDGAITYSKVSGGCSVDASTGTLTYSATGTCVVRATAATSSTYSAGTRDVTFTIAADRPTEPTITSASAGNGTATVAFTVPSSNGGATITGYTATATPGGATGTCSSSPCTVSGLTLGQPYTIRVTATNSAGIGAASLASPSVTPVTSTGAVENLSVVPGNTNLAVSWVAPACIAANTCGTFVNYRVFTKTASTAYVLDDTITTVGSTSRTVPGLVNGTQYDVKVTVTTSTSSADAVAQQVPATTPSAPTDVTVARLTETTVSVGWSPPSSNGGQPITGYTITATSSNGGATVDDTALATDDTLTLTVDKTYTITVRASNLMGLGAISAASPAFNTGLAPQTITVVPEATTMPATSSMLLSTSGSTGTGAKSFAVSSGPCTVSGAALTATAAGTCVVTATIAADALNAAATSTGVPVTVTLAPQTVSWAPTTVFTATPSTVTLASATASAGGLPAYSVTSAGTAGCSFSSGSTLVFTGQGTCTVQVVAGATSTHSASAPVSLTISVIAATRSITWSPSTTLDDTNSGQPASALAVILAGTGTPAYSVSSAGATGCAVTAATAVITFTAPGTCILTATAPSNATYAVATTSVTFTIRSAPQTVTWSPTTDLTVEQSPVTVTPATSTGAGTITYSVTSPGVADCQITPNTGVLSYSEAGQCTVQAMAAARTGYAASAPATVTFDVTASPTPTPTPPSPSMFAPGQPLGLTAVAGDAMASVSWTAPADPGSYPVTDYSVTASPGGGTCLVEAPARTCEIRGLTNGTSYTFRAKALNGAGWGPYSDPSNAVTPRGPAQRSIVITGSRGVVKGSPGVIVTGTSTDLGVGAILRPWVRFPGQTSYAEGTARVLVDASGAFTWQRRTGKVVYVYMETEDASLRSNRVIIRQG
jgi:large repetitive protein